MLHSLRRGDSSRDGTKKRTSVTFGGRVMVYNPMVQYTAAELMIALEAANATIERWQHIVESRSELEPHADKLLETLRTGRRKQDTLIPNKYRYYKRFDELLPITSCCGSISWTKHVISLMLLDFSILTE